MPRAPHVWYVCVSVGVKILTAHCSAPQVAALALQAPNKTQTYS